MPELSSDFIKEFNPKPRKGNLSSYLVFGASGELGENCAKELLGNNKHNALVRLATSKADNIQTLTDRFPGAEIVVADYFDPKSLDKAFDGIEGVMIISRDWIEEDVAMNNVVDAVKKAGVLKHMVRIIGDPPGMRIKNVPERIREQGPRKAGAALQHPLAREILTGAGMPVTYVNMAAYLMKNFINPKLRKPAIEKRGYLMFPYDHAVPLIDSREVGEVAAKILLSDDHRHIGVTYDLENGNDMLTVKEQAEIISEEYGINLGFISDEDMDEYIAASESHPVKRYGLGLMEYSAFEWELQNRFYLSDRMERLLGRKPKTFREWLREHSDHFDLSFYQP